uniref:Uncharacterized protein LOC100182280 n=1 Tax=Phallusia mammillata TaxID=59560 RepID=A0A6F9DHP1_9ASCI|nr:uncharacterized protein LOC100182280 [Phallusia mammillata]
MKVTCGVVLFALLYVINTVVVMAVDPSPFLLNRAFCACKCCDDRPDLCHMHEKIKNLECTPDQCTESLCRHWKDAKCKSGCFCQKCQGALLSRDEYKCALYNGVPDGCQCPDPETISCVLPEPPKSEFESPEVEDARMKLAEYRETIHCVIPCFCTKCKNKVPEGYDAECKKAGPPRSDCDCKNTTCPSSEEVEKFWEMLKETEDVDVEAAKLALEQNAKKIRDETDELNEKMKPLIEKGQTKPVSPTDYKKAKCQLQCLCDKCRAGSELMNKNCDKIIKEREEFCPACPEDLTCPDPDDETTCKMHCFCDVCKYDGRMPQMLLTKCEELAQLDTSGCVCKEEVNCNILDSIDKAQREALAKQEKEKKKEEEKADKKGKIKEKSKMWDEL